jgi:hypothetical protein
MVFETPRRQASFLSLKLAGVWGLRPQRVQGGALAFLYKKNHAYSKGCSETVSKFLRG